MASLRLPERDTKVRLLGCGLANRSDWRGTLGPFLFIPGLAGGSQCHLSDGATYSASAYGHFLQWEDCGFRALTRHTLCFDITLEVHSDPSGSLITPSDSAESTVPFPGPSWVQPQGSHRLQWPGLSSTCCKDNVWLEGSELRSCHHVPVQLFHCHHGGL